MQKPSKNVWLKSHKRNKINKLRGLAQNSQAILCKAQKTQTATKGEGYEAHSTYNPDNGSHSL